MGGNFFEGWIAIATWLFFLRSLLSPFFLFFYRRMAAWALRND